MPWLIALLLLTSCNVYAECDNSWLDGNPRWTSDQLPLYVALDPGSWALWGQAVTDAADKWNESLGLEVFVVFKAPVASELSADLSNNNTGIIPGVLVPHGTNPHFRYAFDPSGIFNKATLRLPIVEWPLEHKTEVAIHELGHALGLAHDTCEISVMFDTYRPQYTGVVRIIPGDIERLKERYGRQQQSTQSRP